MAITKRSNLGAQAGATSVIAIHSDPHRSGPESLIGKPEFTAPQQQWPVHLNQRT
jgi:hypothetical protein